MALTTNPAAEFLRLRKIADECAVALDYLARAERMLRDGDHFSNDLMVASCSVNYLLDSVRVNMSRLTKRA